LTGLEAVTAATDHPGRLRQPRLSVEPLEVERETVLVLRGEFDLTGVDVFKDAVARVRPRHALVLDLRELSFLDSSGLGAMVELYRRAQAEGWSLVLAAPQQAVAMILRISGLDERLEIVESAA
jgi:anti-anti-sigma factor